MRKDILEIMERHNVSYKEAIRYLTMKGFDNHIYSNFEQISLENENLQEDIIDLTNIVNNSEKKIENYIVKNWSNISLGNILDIYEENGNIIGQQYKTDTGPIDILAISKDKKEIVVIELKKGRANDSVIGQIQRYMGFIKAELAKDGQSVSGIIIASEDDLRIKRALTVTKNIKFYVYRVNFDFEERI